MSTDAKLRKAADNIMNPVVSESNGKRVTMGFDKDDWDTLPHDPEHLKIRVIVEDISETTTNRNRTRNKLTARIKKDLSKLKGFKRR